MLCLHIGSSSEMVLTAMDAPVHVQISLQCLNIMQAAADLVWSRVATEFPNIKLALSEGGIGWVPYFLERADSSYRSTASGPGSAWATGSRATSSGSTCHVLHLRRRRTGAAPPHRGREHLVGVRLPALGLDVAAVARGTGHRARRSSRRRGGEITHANAMRTFRFDPFSVRAPERCTVRALRAEAIGWDVEIRDLDTPWEPPSTPMTQQVKLEALGRMREGSGGA